MVDWRTHKQQDMMPDSETKKIKCGVAGVGYLGQHHARIYNSLSSCELVGVFDPTYETSNKVAGEHNCKVFNSLKDLGNSCEVVSVVSPTDLHAEVAIPLMNAGCHLLIEKPLCVSLSEAEGILNVAQKNKTIVQVGHIEHYNPVMTFLEKEVEQPKYLTVERLAPFQPRELKSELYLI